jgi:DDE family transposase
MAHLWWHKKWGRCVGKTKRGKGSKIMAVAGGIGLPIAISVGSASPHEVKLVEMTLESSFIEETPQRMIGDRAFDSDPLDKRLKVRSIEMIAAHRSNRKKEAT